MADSLDSKSCRSGFLAAHAPRLGFAQKLIIESQMIELSRGAWFLPYRLKLNETADLGRRIHSATVLGWHDILGRVSDAIC